MIRLNYFAAFLHVSVFATAVFGQQPVAGPGEPLPAKIAWSQLPGLPDPNGFAGPFAGVANDALIVAGGANFPNKPLWETDKVWYDRAFVLTEPDGSWQSAKSRLPRPLAYGISLSSSQPGAEGILCIGGGDSKSHYADCFLLQWTDGDIAIKDLPALPKPLAFSCGAIVDGIVYVAGGLQKPDSATPLKSFWCLDLAESVDDRGWRELPSWPGPPRFLSVAGAHDGAFYLFGGTDLVVGDDAKPVRQYLTDAYRFQPATDDRDAKWTRLADQPHPTVAAPTPAVVHDGHFHIFSGDDGKNYLRTDDLRDKHPGFPPRIQSYRIGTDRWSVTGGMPKEPGDDPVADPNSATWPPVTTTTVRWRDRIVLPSGEVRPRVRTPRVLSGRFPPDTQPQSRIRRHALILVGLPGDEAHKRLFTSLTDAWTRWLTTAMGIREDDLTLLAGEEARKENLEKRITAVKKRIGAADGLWVLFLGHANDDNQQAFFHLPGRDVNHRDIGRMFADVDCREQVFWMTHTCAGWFIQPLSKKGRIVISATTPDGEINETEFPYSLADVMGKAPEQLDQDGDRRVSVTEMFDAVVKDVGDRFESDMRVPTEHAQLDDNGDGRGTELSELAIPTTESDDDTGPTSAAVDGLLAHETFLPFEALRSTDD